MLQKAQIRKASTFWTDQSNTIAEFITYLKQNEMNKIERISSYSDYIVSVALKTKLLYWEEKYYKNYSAANTHNCITDSSPEIKHLLENIFIHKTVNVLFYTGININFENNTVSRYQEYARYAEAVPGIPHTHIYQSIVTGKQIGRAHV